MNENERAKEKQQKVVASLSEVQESDLKLACLGCSGGSQWAQKRSPTLACMSERDVDVHSMKLRVRTFAHTHLFPGVSICRRHHHSKFSFMRRSMKVYSSCVLSRCNSCSGSVQGTRFEPWN